MSPHWLWGAPVHMKSHTADGNDPVYMALGGGHSQVTGVDLVNRGIHTVLKKLCCLKGNRPWGGTHCLLLSPHLSGPHAVYEVHTTYMQFTPFMWLVSYMGFTQFMKVALFAWGSYHLWGSPGLSFLSVTHEHCLYGIYTVHVRVTLYMEVYISCRHRTVCMGFYRGVIPAVCLLSSHRQISLTSLFYARPGSRHQR